MGDDRSFVIVTGMSGAGRSSVLKKLEDDGYFCVDNLPIPFLNKFIKFVFDEKEGRARVALGLDIRNGKSLEGLLPMLENIKKSNIKILFLDAGTETLVRRYKETRRIHPLSASLGISLEEGIELERKSMAFLKERADYIIDSSTLLVRELNREVDKIFAGGEDYANFIITIQSFGFKHGIPSDADLVFDVRFLPNPYYEPELKNLTGNDSAVYDYVMASPQADAFLSKLIDMLEFLIPSYIAEGRNSLVIGIGCTGGHHRSVTIANALRSGLSGSPYSIKMEHRDVKR